MPYNLKGELVNVCNTHGNKIIYSNKGTMISVILKTQERFGIKLTWYECKVHGGYHLTKWENKQY